MVITLLLTTFLIALVVASIVVFIFTKPIDSILKRVVPIEISSVWAKYLKFALYVVGIGGGVRVCGGTLGEGSNKGKPRNDGPFEPSLKDF